MPRRGRRSRVPLGGSVRNRLVFLFFAITSGAVGFIYLYVVPQLSSSLTAERLERLERLGGTELAPVAALLDRDADRTEIAARLRTVASTVDARVTLLGVEGGEPSFVIADSDLESAAIESSYPAARGAVGSGLIRSAIETTRGERTGETAVPILSGGVPVWVAVLSTPLGEVDDNVALIKRQILIAGAIALTAALVAAWIAAGAHARRLRRLERAAVQVAEGDFAVPIPIDADDEVGQLAASFDEMQGRLANLDSARREFIANASHELRTPVTSLGGFVELLDDDDEPDRESRREFNRLMRVQVERLTQLTSGLLDLSKLDAGAMRVRTESFELSVIAAEAADEFGARALAADATVQVVSGKDGDPLVQADPERALQVLRILIDNAIKHTEKGTKIIIETTTINGAGAVTVTDSGPGIPADGRERVFERFYTADSVSGSGLGLAIGRELARRMGGELSLVSGRRGRTSFSLSLPLAEVAR